MQMRKVENTLSPVQVCAYHQAETIQCLNSITHVHSYLLYISKSVSVTQCEQDVSIG